MADGVYDLESAGEMHHNVPTSFPGRSECEIDFKEDNEEIKDNTLEKLASKLLKHNFILTALEFHTELVESGRELPKLRDYFSNPGNFEKHIHETETSPALPRTSSVQTFDSLDFTRYSDDGERQVEERIAVLEFELRKAKETIKALRTNLTVATESDPNTPTSGSSKSIVQETVKPHEKRALNFLINEYLLCNSYKLTSITFSDENDDQDFEDWDDVGLNIPKPQNLLQLYRNYGRYMYLNNEVANKEIQTDAIPTAVKESDVCIKRSMWESLDLNQSSKSISSNTSNEQSHKSERTVPYEFQKNLLSLCQTQKIAQDNRLIGEITDIVNSQDSVVSVLSRCLPHIVPNILLAKREELIPLILCAIALHPDPKERDKLLNILFNLIKRPDEEQRHMILTGLVAIAQHLGPSRVEAELLPQCWEQITHRYVERRLLVAESCGVLAPYVMSGIRSSLLLSMLHQMLQEDKDDLVRETVACKLLFLSLEDRALNVVDSGLNTLLPSIAAWSFELSNLESHLFPHVMSVLNNHFKVLSDIPLPSVLGSIQPEEQQIILFSRTISMLLPFLFVSVIKSGPYVENPDISCSSPVEFDVDRLPTYPSSVLNPSIIFGDGDELMSAVKAFDRYLNSEWYKPWEQHDWAVNEFLPWLHSIFSYVNSQRQAVVHDLVELLHNFCHLFGRSFYSEKYKAIIFISIVNRAPSNRSTYQDATIPIYVAGVLGALHQAEDRQELLEFLQDLLCSVSLNHLPDTSIKAALVELRVTAGRLFEILVGVVSESLLRTRVTPALVTLASDPEIVVRIATVPAFGAIMELSSQKDLLEKAHMQLQTFLDDQLYRDQHLLYVEVIRTFAKNWSKYRTQV
ncbi:RAB11-binding protein RELCH homolog [Caerostris extrusa]|uniref:RAB11-binding protein RELCH homolog n=1 Tax=Caerostris extrusa TaxID=172846 RepID=A0AAV4XMN6_CAEEX|nr:RAB11-binding protein RELCH homolog [Caerostris extrusa]